MRTAIEIEPDGTPLRVFHRTGTKAWTHPVGEPRSDAGCHCPGERVDPDQDSTRSRKNTRDKARLRRVRAERAEAVVANPGAAATAGTASGEALP